MAPSILASTEGERVYSSPFPLIFVNGRTMWPPFSSELPGVRSTMPALYQGIETEAGTRKANLKNFWGLRDPKSEVPYLF